MDDLSKTPLAAGGIVEGQTKLIGDPGSPEQIVPIGNPPGPSMTTSQNSTFERLFTESVKEAAEALAAKTMLSRVDRDVIEGALRNALHLGASSAAREAVIRAEIKHALNVLEAKK